jgi:hypothetical protein
MIFYNDPAVALFRENNRKVFVDKYVLRYHPVQPTGERIAKAIPRPGWRENIHYSLTRFFLARKQDFVIESKKRGAGTTGTKVTSVSTRTGASATLKSAVMEAESQVGTESMMLSSAQPETGTVLGSEAQETSPAYVSTIPEETSPVSAAPVTNDEKTPFVAQTLPTMDAVVDMEQGFERDNGVPAIIRDEIVPVPEATYIPIGTQQDDDEEEAELDEEGMMEAIQNL